LESLPAIIPFVRHLSLSERRWDEILPLLVGFESVSKLTLNYLPVHHLNSAQSARFSAAVDVRLEDIRFATAGQLIRFICAFPCLQILYISSTGTYPDDFAVDVPAPSAFRPSPHLRVLELDDVCMDAMLDWFLSLPDRPPLRALGLRLLSAHGSETLANLLLVLENSLEFFLISTAVRGGMFVISLSLIDVACQFRMAFAVRPTPKHMPTLPSNRAQRRLH
jgi:hypothetical protein